MYQISDEVAKLFADGARQYIKISFDGTEEAFEITDSDIVQNGLSVNRFSATGNSVELGNMTAAELTLKLENGNGRFDNVVFEGAELFVRIGVSGSDGNIRYVPLGYFTVDEAPRKLSQITLPALDRMVMFDKDFDRKLFSFPMTVKSFVEKICSVCGVGLADINFDALPNSSYIIKDCPDGDGIVYRQLLALAAEILGVCGFIDWDGKLALKWYSPSGVIFDTHNRYTSDLAENEITITGVNVISGDDVYSAGNEGYMLSVEDNVLVQHDFQSVATELNSKLGGFSYTPFNASVLAMPHIYPLDMAVFVDKNGNEHSVAITDVTFASGKSTVIKGKGESVTKKGYATLDPLTKKERTVIESLKKQTESKISEKEQALLALNSTIANAFGLFVTGIVDETGAKTYYFHNGNSLENSNVIYTFNSGGFAWCNSWNSGSPVWNYGITKDGNAVLNVLSTYKIISDYIEAGAVTADKIASKAVNADKIDVDDLFAQNISMTGEFVHKLSVYVDADYRIATGLANHLAGIKAIPDDELPYYDINNDGVVDRDDLKLILFMANGVKSLEELANEYPTNDRIKKSELVLRISLKNPENAISITGKDIWGYSVNKKFGIKSPFSGSTDKYSVAKELDWYLEDSATVKALKERREFKKYTKTFVKSDWTKLTEEPLYMVQIKKSEHKLENPVVANAMLSYTWTDEDGVTHENVQSMIDIGDRVLSTGTVKLYVNCDLTKYEKYDLKIILQGD